MTNVSKQNEQEAVTQEKLSQTLLSTGGGQQPVYEP